MRLVYLACFGCNWKAFGKAKNPEQLHVGVVLQNCFENCKTGVQVTLATVNLDDPKNAPLLERFGVLSFPVGKIFYEGRFRNDFMGGTESGQIIAEMLQQRDNLLKGDSGGGGKQEL